MMKGKSRDGRQCGVMSHRFRITAKKANLTVDANSGRLYFIGLTIHENYDDSRDTPKIHNYP